jgi:hypothetical protein
MQRDRLVRPTRSPVGRRQVIPRSQAFGVVGAQQSLAVGDKRFPAGDRHPAIAEFVQQVDRPQPQPQKVSSRLLGKCTGIAGQAASGGAHLHG